MSVSQNIKNTDIAEEVAKCLLKINAVTFRFDPPYTFTSGLKSPIYLDNRLVMSYPSIRNQIIDFYIQVIKEKICLKNVDWISATATAAIPQGAWVADRLGLPMVFVRPSTKSYGKGNKVEGFVKKGAKVLIVEDHISTAESAAGNVQSIRELGGKVDFCIATTTYETGKSQESLAANKVSLFALTTGKIIVETAASMGYLKKAEKEKVDLWFENPPEWAGKMGL